MTWFQRLLLTTIFATFVLVIIGGTVRATDSGLGCPDWPTCHGELIPPAEYHTLIEFSHRTAATVVGVLFLGVTYFAFKTERRNPTVFWLAFAAGVVLAAQIILGGITVKKELPTEIVAAHLGTAMTFMALLIVTLGASLARNRGVAPSPGGMRSGVFLISLSVAAMTFGTLILGSYISGHEASLACTEWPQCGGGAVLGDGTRAESLHMLHRLVAGALGLVMMALLYVTWQSRAEQPRLFGLGVFAAANYLVQALIGAANVWTELASGVVIVHLTLAALLWCIAVTLTLLSLEGSRRTTDDEAPGRAGAAARVKVAEWAR